MVDVGTGVELRVRGWRREKDLEGAGSCLNSCPRGSLNVATSGKLLFT
jgi:hypothetical protein